MKPSKDIASAFWFATYRLVVVMAALVPYIQTQYTFDIYRWHHFLEMAKTAAWVYSAFVIVAAASLIFKFSFFELLKKLEEALLSRPFRELFPSLSPGEGWRLLRRPFVFIARNIIPAFFFLVFIRNIIASGDYLKYLTVAFVVMAVPALLKAREWKKSFPVRAGAFAATAAAAAATFAAAGLDFGAPASERSLAVPYILLGWLLLAMAVSGYWPRVSDGEPFAQYFIGRLSACYRALFAAAFAGLAVFYMFLFALIAVALTFIYYKQWAVCAIALAAVGYLIFRFLPKKRLRNMFFYLIFLQILGQFFIYLRPPATEEICGALPDYNGEVETLLNLRQMRDNEKMKGNPYDTVYDSETDRLLVSFKNRAGHGSLTLLSVSEKCALDTVNTFHADELFRIMFPERLAIDTIEKKFYASVKSPNRFTFLAGSYKGDKIDMTHRFYYGSEEITNVVALPEHNLLAVVFLATPTPSIRFFNPETFEMVERIFFDPQDLAEYMAHDKKRDRLYFPAHSLVASIFNPHVYYIDMKTLRLETVKIPGLKYRLRTLYGVEFDNEADRMYISSPVSRQVIVLDGETLKPVKEVPTGDHVRKIALAPKAGLLYITCYGDGAVDVMDTRTNEIIRTYRLGPLTRSVTVDPATERVFAASACGVFELKTDISNEFPVNRIYRMFNLENIPIYFRELSGRYMELSAERR